MASKSKRTGGSSVTAPKGRPTAARNAGEGRTRRLSPTMEWVLAFVVLAAIVVAIVVIWGDAGSPAHTGAGPDAVPAPAAAVG